MSSPRRITHIILRARRSASDGASISSFIIHGSQQRAAFSPAYFLHARAARAARSLHARAERAGRCAGAPGMRRRRQAVTIRCFTGRHVVRSRWPSRVSRQPVARRAHARPPSAPGHRRRALSTPMNSCPGGGRFHYAADADAKYFTAIAPRPPRPRHIGR